MMSAPQMPHRLFTEALAVDPELRPARATRSKSACVSSLTSGLRSSPTRHPRDRGGLTEGGGQSGRRFSLFVLEHHARRPLTDHAEAILEISPPRRSRFSPPKPRRGELGSRIQMTAVVNNYGLRHGHMVNINHEIMLEGMRADFLQVDELSQRLVERARQAERVSCKTPAGTDFVAELSPKLKWLKTSGIITKEKWGNLPGGEIFTSPMNTSGVFVVDGVVGDYLCERYGDLKDSPLTIEVENNRIVSLKSENKDLRDDFRLYTSTDENSNRVGEFAVGTNTACTHIIGNILQDEKIPGIHIAFGHPYAEHTGQNWISKTHIDCVGRDFDIWFDDEQVMAKGKFLV
jgi:hypothetical protein